MYAALSAQYFLMDRFSKIPGTPYLVPLQHLRPYFSGTSFSNCPVAGVVSVIDVPPLSVRT